MYGGGSNQHYRPALPGSEYDNSQAQQQQQAQQQNYFVQSQNPGFIPPQNIYPAVSQSSVANLYQQHQVQQQQQQQQQLQNQIHFHHQINSQHSAPSPLMRPGSYNYSAQSPYSFSSMQSPPPSIGSPGQPYSNASAHHSNPALSPTRSLSSPIGYPHGSPLARQHSGLHHPQSHNVVHNNLTSPTPIPASPSNIQQFSPAPPHQMSQPSPSASQRPVPIPRPSGPTSGASVKSPGPTPYSRHEEPLRIPQPVEEPFPVYPTPEETERIAATAKAFIPEVVLERIYAKAGVSFLDPKIGNLIALSSQMIINDIIKDAIAANKELNPGNEKMLSRAALEKALVDRGMKQLPPDPTNTLK